MSMVVRKCWLPEVLEVNVSQDLVAQLQQGPSIMESLSTLRRQLGIETPVFRVRDDALLADRTYAISINGIRVGGRKIDRTSELESELIGELETLCDEYAEALRFFTELRNQSP